MEALARRIRSGDHSGSEPRRKTAPGERLRPIKNTSLATVDSSEGEIIKAQVDERASLIEEGLNPDIRRGVQLQTRPTEEIVGDGVEPTAAKAADPLTDPKGTPRLEPEINPDKPVESAARRELGEYYKDAEKLLGKPPEFEKGEESDFSSRRWLALAQFGTNMLRAGGDKTVFQAMGEAAQPALKELISIGKEEKKLKGDLRKERNVQKQRDYSDRIAKIGIAQKLKSADLDHTKTMAEIYDKKKRRLFDERTLDETIRKNNVTMANVIMDTAKKEYDLTHRKKGTNDIGDVRQALEKTDREILKMAVKNQGMPGYTSTKSTRESIAALRRLGRVSTLALYANTTIDEKGDKIDLNTVFGITAAPKGEFKDTVEGGQFRRK